jgi:hypothetical protein
LEQAVLDDLVLAELAPMASTLFFIILRPLAGVAEYITKQLETLAAQEAAQPFGQSAIAFATVAQALLARASRAEPLE